MRRDCISVGIVAFLLLAGCTGSAHSVDAELCNPVNELRPRRPNTYQSLDPARTSEFYDTDAILNPEIAWAVSVGRYYNNIAAFEAKIDLIFGDSLDDQELVTFDALLGVALRSVPLDSDIIGGWSDTTDYLFTSTHGFLYSFDFHTGEQNWNVDLKASTSHDPIQLGDTVFVTSGSGSGENGIVTAVDRESGEIVWSTELPQHTEVPGRILAPAFSVGSGTVFVNGFSFIYALDIKTGVVCWSTQSGQTSGLASIDAWPAIFDDRAYVIINKRLYSLDAHDGSKHWSIGDASNLSAVAASDGMVYYGDDDGSLNAVGARSGDKAWSVEIGDFTNTHIVIVNDMLYATSDDEFLYGIEKTTGEIAWKLEVGKVVTQPIAAFDHLYLIAGGELVAIRDD